MANLEKRPLQVQEERPWPMPMPMPRCEELDRQSVFSSSSSSTISRPTRAFFLGCRESQIIDIRALEEGQGPLASTPVDSLGIRSPPAIVVEPPSAPGSAPPPRTPPSDEEDYLPLPPKKGSRAYRYARWNLGSVYRRIFTLAFLVNFLVLIILIGRSAAGGSRLTYKDASIAVSANLFVALLIRNEHVVNIMFIVFGTWPKNLPLRFRRLFAKVYSYGGIHSGCGVAATVWYIAFVALITIDYQQRDRDQTLSALRGYVYLVTYSIFVMLALILVFAHPKLRVAMHNWFEGVHRFMGWSVVLLFWVQTLLVTFDDAPAAGLSGGQALVASPSFWLLVLITLLVIYPWTRLRRRDVQVEALSKHCVKLNFDFADGHYGQAIRLSDAPLRETHAFAVIPNPKAVSFLQTDSAVALLAPSSPELSGYSSADESDGGATDLASIKAAAQAKAAARKHHQQQLAALSGLGLSNAGRTGFSVVISDAGDWTRKIIASPPRQIWTRGVPQYGVMRVAGMFEPVIIMATGSGIAPCLALFAEMPDHPVRVIWSAPSPLETFGKGVVDTVLRADPDAIIHDTRRQGRPDLVAMAYRMYEASGRVDTAGLGLDDGRRRGRDGRPLGKCEAVVIISNQRVTRKVVYGLETRGVPAYGAIFDS
ncbi:hypothetical protein RB595_008584 [Gaeumannomyces hyphopodioides]